MATPTTRPRLGIGVARKTPWKTHRAGLLSSPQHRRSVGCRSLAGTRRTPRRHPRWRSRDPHRLDDVGRGTRDVQICFELFAASVRHCRALVCRPRRACPRRMDRAAQRDCVFLVQRRALRFSNAVVRARRGAPRWGAGGGHEFPVVVAGRAVGPCLRRSVGAHPEAREQADVRRDMHFTLDPRNAWEGPLPSRSRDAKEHCEEARAGGRARHQATD